MNKTSILFGSFLLCTMVAGKAQETQPLPKADGQKSRPEWYVGAQGGVPFGISTFSSFMADKTYLGWSAGVYGGYAFNSIFSLELSMKLGKAGMAAQDCCTDAGYWLGKNGKHYYMKPPTGKSYNYADLKSDVDLQQYGLQANINLLGCFNRTRNSRWSLDVSPVAALVTTKAAVSSQADGTPIYQDGTNLHWGLGGNLQAGYRLSDHIKIGIYSSALWINRAAIDGMPRLEHKNNALLEGGVRIGWMFGKPGKNTTVAASKTQAKPVIAAQSAEKRKTTKDKAESKPENKPENKPESKPVIAPVAIAKNEPATLPESEPAATPESKPVVASLATDNRQIAFPAIYFDFNSTVIPASEKSKLPEIHQLIKQHPDAHILITGHCDARGSREVNTHYSYRRAEVVKKWLVEYGIDASRIRIEGRGTDFNEKSPAKARRAETTATNGRKENLQ